MNPGVSRLAAVDPGAIAAYLESLAGALAFDRALAREARDEVEDHLWQAAGDGSPEAQKRAVARFGDARHIAAQMAAVALAGQARRAGATVLLALGAAVLAMAARVQWYELTQWGLCETALELNDTLGLLDRVCFLLAAAGGAAGWFLEGARMRLWTLAAAGLAGSVLCDGLLTALRLSGWEYSVDFIVPLSSLAIEAACAAALAIHVFRMSARIEAVARLQAHSAG